MGGSVSKNVEATCKNQKAGLSELRVAFSSCSEPGVMHDRASMEHMLDRSKCALIDKEIALLQLVTREAEEVTRGRSTLASTAISGNASAWYIRAHATEFMMTDHKPASIDEWMMLDADAENIVLRAARLDDVPLLTYLWFHPSVMRWVNPYRACFLQTLIRVALNNRSLYVLRRILTDDESVTSPAKVESAAGAAAASGGSFIPAPTPCVKGKFGPVSLPVPAFPYQIVYRTPAYRMNTPNVDAAIITLLIACGWEQDNKPTQTALETHLKLMSSAAAGPTAASAAASAGGDSSKSDVAESSLIADNYIQSRVRPIDGLIRFKTPAYEANELLYEIASESRANPAIELLLRCGADPNSREAPLMRATLPPNSTTLVPPPSDHSHARAFIDRSRTAGYGRRRTVPILARVWDQTNFLDENMLPNFKLLLAAGAEVEETASSEPAGEDVSMAYRGVKGSPLSVILTRYDSFGPTIASYWERSYTERVVLLQSRLITATTALAACGVGVYPVSEWNSKTGTYGDRPVSVYPAMKNALETGRKLAIVKHSQMLENLSPLPTVLIPLIVAYAMPPLALRELSTAPAKYPVILPDDHIF